MALQEKSKSNITRFREDFRLAVAGGLRSLALIGLLATVVFCIYQYRDELNLANARRIYSYLRAASGEKSEFTSFSFEAGLDSDYALFDMGLAVYGGNTFRYVTALSGGDFVYQANAARPTLSAGQKQMLIYDRGGKTYAVVNGYSCIGSGTLESPIVSGQMSERGAFCLVTDENGYRAAVTMFDARLNRIFKWQTSDYYIIMACPAPDGRSLAVLCASERDGAPYYSVRVCSVRQEEPLCEIPLGERQVYSLCYDREGNLVIIAADGVYIYESDGTLKGSSVYAAGSLIAFGRHSEEPPVVAIRAESAGEGIEVRLVSPDGTARFTGRYEGIPRAIDLRGNTLAILFRTRLVTVDLSGAEPVVRAQRDTGAQDVLVRADGRVVLVYSDRAELVTPEEEHQ